jgi:hypothetical protein
MTPLTREEREAIARSHPDAEPGEIAHDIDEYEALIALRFAQDPSKAPAAEPEARRALRRGGERRGAESRLLELHDKLFGAQ